MKAQVAIEFLAIIGFSVLILLGLLLALMSSHNQQQQITAQQEASQLADQLQQEIILASTVKTGYIRTITLPEKLANKEYEIRVLPEEVYVQVGSHIEARRTPLVTGNFSSQTTIIRNQTGVFLQ